MSGLPVAPVTPEQLVAAIRRGDAGAVERLIELHGARLLAIATSILSSRHDAEEVVQEALVGAIKSIGTLQNPATFEGWLNRIVANAALGRLRRHRGRRERSIEALLPQFREDGHRTGVGPSWVDAPGARLEREETCAMVRRCIEELPEPHREIILLRDMLGFDTAEAAATLGLTETAAKVRLHRARQALRTLIQEELGDE